MHTIFAKSYHLLPANVQRLLSAAANSQLTRNTGWMLFGEGFSRLSRLLTILALAAVLPASEYGLAMLALACHELIRTFTRIGAGSKVIQCDDASLAQVVANAYVLNWIIAILVAGAQYALAPTLANYYQNPQLAVLLQLMALSYFFYPLVAMRACWAQRCQNIKHYSFCSALAISSENICAALGLLLGVGVVAIAYAKIFAAIVWVVGFTRVCTPKFGIAFNWSCQLDLVRFSIRVLSSELLRNLRSHIDLLCAGRMLSPELFGLYSFAKSAGAGLAQSLGNAYLGALYPKCAAEYRSGKIRACAKNVLLITAAICIVFLVQATLAPVYVPILFNANWQGAAPMVAILCLSAIPAIYLDSACLLQRVQGRLNHELLLQFLALSMLLVAIVLFQPATSLEFATLTTVTSVGWLLMAIGLTQLQLRPINFSALTRRKAHRLV